MVDFFNELGLLWNIVTCESNSSIFGGVGDSRSRSNSGAANDAGTSSSGGADSPAQPTSPEYEQFPPGLGYPPGFEYRWRESGSSSSPRPSSSKISIGGVFNPTISCGADEYIERVLLWARDILQSQRYFQETAKIKASDRQDFHRCCNKLMSKFFRVYAIMYTSYVIRLESLKALGHLNTSFKHFTFFAFVHDWCVDTKELDAMKEVVDSLRSQYEGLLNGGN